MYLAATMMGLAAYAAFCARKSYRDPDNWHLDPYSKDVLFHNWVEVCFSGVLGVLFAIAGVLLAVL